MQKQGIGLVIHELQNMKDKMQSLVQNRQDEKTVIIYKVCELK